MSTSLQTVASGDMPDRVLCILGMHRSGTSCLTGSLQEAGLQLGDCHTWNPYNTKGNRENQRIVDLNDAVLAGNNGAWDRPPAQIDWEPEQLDSARSLLAGHAGQVFGFKDPRTLLVLDGWLEVFPQMEFVGIFRSPAAVADSLARRSEMPREAALDLWMQYNLRLYQRRLERRFPLLCFDDDPARFRERLSSVVDGLRLPGAEAGMAFFDETMRQAVAVEEGRLPWRVRRLYRRMRRLAERGWSG